MGSGEKHLPRQGRREEGCVRSDPMGQIRDKMPSQSEGSAGWSWQFQLSPVIVPSLSRLGRTPGQATGGGDVPAASPESCENPRLQAPPAFTCPFVLSAEVSERNGLQTFSIRHHFSKNTLRGASLSWDVSFSPDKIKCTEQKQKQKISRDVNYKWQWYQFLSPFRRTIFSATSNLGHLPE